MWWFQSVYNILVFYSGWMEKKKTWCSNVRWCNDFENMGFQEQSKMNPQAPRRGMSQWWGHWAQPSCWAGHCQQSTKRNTRKRNNSGAQPSAELQDLTVVCSECDLSSKNSHGVACFLWKGYSILLHYSFQNTDIRKNMVVTFPHHPGGSIFPQENKC